MFATLPLMCFSLLWGVLSFQKLNETASCGWRRSFVLACLIWATFLTLTTEFLSLFAALTFTGLILALSLALGVLAGTAAWRIRAGWRVPWPVIKLDRFSLFLTVCMGVILLGLALVAWVAPPNTWDSMTYHLGRVVHWIQNRSVAHYPTNITRQLWQNPFAEYVITHLQILSGSDRLANFVQWFSLAAGCVGTSLIAAQLGANLKGQCLAAVFSLSLPMGLLQAASTQNDYVVSLWCVCFVYMTIAFIQKPTLTGSLWVGLSLGLAMLTKTTTYLFCAPLVILLPIYTMLRHRRAFLKLMIAVLGPVLLLNAGHLARNVTVYANLFGPLSDPTFTVANATISLPVMASNIVRNLGLHAWTPVPTVKTRPPGKSSISSTTVSWAFPKPTRVRPGPESPILYRNSLSMKVLRAILYI
jgi:hypothetical protein